MKEEILHKVVTEVSKTCLKKVKILAIQNDTTLAIQARNVLEKVTSTKKYETLLEDI